MPPQSRNKGESNRGLVITLVFFILATLALGVAAYYGFADQEKNVQAAKKAEADKKLFQDERDWYKAQAMLYRAYMGQAQTLDGADQLGTLKTQIDQGSLGKNAKDKEEVTKLLKEVLEKRLGWNGNTPKATYESQYNDLFQKYDALAKQNEDLLKANNKANEALKKSNDEAQAAGETYAKQLKEVTDKATEDQKKLQKLLEDARGEVKTVAGKLEKAQLEAEQTKKTLTKQVSDKNKELKFANDRINDQQSTIESLNAKSTVAPASMRTDWKIVRMDSRGTNPYINLGSSDHVKPQLTFTIHGVGLDGKPNPKSKGTLEVVNVIGAHLSQTRVTSVNDPDRHPILQGDVIYNASWNPTMKKHVALVGIMDITGDGRDSLNEFMRNLERQNIVVDAYVDPKDGSIKGQITFRTDYLIIGESQAFSPTGRSKPEDDTQTRARQELQRMAAKYGVKVMALHKYLEMIGYRLPRSTRTDDRTLYNPSLRPDQKPRLGGEKPPEAAPADK